MCGRVRLSSDVSEIRLVFSIPPQRPTPNFPPSWNVAPTDPLPVALIDPNEQTTPQAGSDTKPRRTVLAAYFRIADFTSEPNAYRARNRGSNPNGVDALRYCRAGFG